MWKFVTRIFGEKWVMVVAFIMDKSLFLINLIWKFRENVNYCVICLWGKDLWNETEGAVETYQRKSFLATFRPAKLFSDYPPHRMIVRYWRTSLLASFRVPEWIFFMVRIFYIEGKLNSNVSKSIWSGSIADIITANELHSKRCFHTRKYTAVLREASCKFQNQEI